MIAYLLLQDIMEPVVETAPVVPRTPWEMVLAGSTLTQAVFALLVLLSLLSWGIMLAKWREFRRVERTGDSFLRDFEHASTLEEASRIAARAKQGPHTRVFHRAVQFLSDTRPAMAGTPERSARYSGSQVEALRLVLDSETNAERDQLGSYLPWLATIAAVSPLLGLLGTVIGVIYAFIGIAEKGSGNLAAVAPGVAEALIATALALAVAIPAVFAYNLFANRLNRLDGDLEGFGSELIALLVREGKI
ncbi:MAG TPA: MotA/TolQ/ExbB proton channel family protein [Gemmatimonadales bacterium]